MDDDKAVNLKPLADDVWHAESVLRMPWGARLPVRMTVLRLADASLLVCSPIQLSADLAQAVEALGPVRYFVAPNAYHHVFLARWQARFPQALCYGPGLLRKKRQDLQLDHLLEESGTEPWGPAVELRPIEGMPKIHEFALFHRPSRSLVVTDLIFNVRDAQGMLAWVMRIMGTHGRAASSRLLRLFIKDRAAYTRSVQHLLDLPAERVIMAHGEVLEGEACVALQTALLDARRPQVQAETASNIRTTG
jgi:hypothetical protein